MNDTLLSNDAVMRQYDYIIIGGRSAGCVVAGRLAANSEASVLLIESGGSDTAIQEIEHPLMWA
ncbi:choline dehydrogenase [Mucilaginibacter lappiensis]|uniref:Choline dehydrogenase n=1 Tax=Mucilaginibacter lappiensis TaxID=354630 RepID=A0ABR6PDG0_9SPHI|nr:choline dehydrogenase [Mucilaginibacter lappiensis]SIP97175.1 choline dehydrogenase [Mucilaginibacter lappiensis]